MRQNDSSRESPEVESMRPVKGATRQNVGQGQASLRLELKAARLRPTGAQPIWREAIASRNHHTPGTKSMLRRDILICSALAAFVVSGLPASAEDAKISLFKVVTVKDEIVIGLSADELKALGGTDASAVAHALAQKGDMAVWQYNVHRGANGELQQAPTAKIGLIASSSLRVEPYTTRYAIVPHQ
jgi:hypothetical protein